MMVTERLIRKTLRRLARQQVTAVLQPGNVWLIERAVSEMEGDDVVAALRTCHLRGWVAIQQDAVPSAQVGPNGELPPKWAGIAPVYRVTEAGWNRIVRYYSWVIATFAASLAALVATLVSLFVVLGGHH